ncbi:MAG: c-type cytochrome [Thiotrichales bacterium]
MNTVERVEAFAAHRKTLPAATAGRRPVRHRASQSSSGALTLLGLPLLLAGCFDSDDDPARRDVIRSAINATDGGVVTSIDQRFSATIPPGALSANTEVTIRPRELTGPTGAMTAAGAAYELDFTPDVTLATPIRLEFKLQNSPTHPQLGESAVFAAEQWQRTGSSFHRASTNTVVSLVSAEGIYRPVLRRLLAETGDGVTRGQALFLDETFGNEAFFGGTLGLHTVLNDISPAAAVAAGVQVDLAKMPQGIVDVLLGSNFAAKQTALADPAVTRALLKANAVIGVKATFADADSTTVTAAGITCALCHVNVATTEFELAPGVLSPLPIGALKLDGQPNLRMDAGAILALTPFAVAAGAPTVEFLNSFGPGRFDVRALPDNPLEDSVANPTSFPPLWNFADLTAQGYAFNWDGLFRSSSEPELALASQAEAVYDLVMHANGAFGTSTGTVAPQLSAAPPESLVTALVEAEAAEPGNVIPEQALLDLQSFQRSLVSPAPQPFDETLAEQGFTLFNDKAQCAGCHRTAEFTGPVVTARITLTTPAGGLAGGIKTPGLRGIASTAPYFHDGSAATLGEVMDVYSGRIVNALSEAEKAAIVEYMKSL